MNRYTRILIFAIFAAAAFVYVEAQESAGLAATPAGIRVGERLSYNISFQRYENVGFAELYAASRGKLGDADAVELRLKIKTTGILSAAFYQIDQTRTTFANAETGAPLLVRHQDNSGVSVRETVSNYVASPAPGLDILTLLYKARQNVGAGSFILVEGDRSHSVTFAPTGAERIKTDAGEYDTTVSTVQSDYLAELGITAMKIAFSSDDARIPVQAKFKTAKGEFRITLASIQMVEPEPEATPTPVAVQTPKPPPTPRPTATPEVYVDNEPLSGDLGFVLGEKLTYRVSNGPNPMATVLLEARERKQIGGEDTLVLSASVLSSERGNAVVSNGDTVIARVDPETLAPAELTVKLSGPLAFLNETVKFDQRGGAITAGANSIDAPIGTHSILSLLYAVRSFNLNPSKTSSNPVNDTRVAVYWQKKAYIFILRPSEAEPITVNGIKVFARRITIKTDVPQIDALGLTVWLTYDENRVPVRMTLGSYQAELIAQSRNSLK